MCWGEPVLLAPDVQARRSAGSGDIAKDLLTLRVWCVWTPRKDVSWMQTPCSLSSSASTWLFGFSPGEASYAECLECPIGGTLILFQAWVWCSINRHIFKKYPNKRIICTNGRQPSSQGRNITPDVTSRGHVVNVAREAVIAPCIRSHD